MICLNSIKDKNGIEIEEFDLLKVFHFIGARRKKYYIYTWVKKVNDKLVCFHLDGENPDYFILFALKNENFEIIQSNNWKKLR